jgi:hypothetical protein
MVEWKMISYYRRLIWVRNYFFLARIIKKINLNEQVNFFHLGFEWANHHFDWL